MAACRPTAKCRAGSDRDRCRDTDSNVWIFPKKRTTAMLYILIVGLVAGILARLISPGPNNPGGFILTAVLGIAGAFLATFVGQMIGHYGPDQRADGRGDEAGALVGTARAAH